MAVNAINERPLTAAHGRPVCPTHMSDPCRPPARAECLAVMVCPGAPSVAGPVALGVARIGAGAALAQAAHALVRRATRELLKEGTFGALAGGHDYGGRNALLTPTAG